MDLDRVVVTASPRYEMTEVVIEDAAVIAELLSFFEEQNHGWHRSYLTPFPTPQVTINFKSADQFVFSFYLGKGWIGWTDSGEHGTKHLSKTDRKRFFDLLDIDDPTADSR